MKEILLQKIANTIACNLESTEDVGLFHGKTGTAMFLYAYARHTGRRQYEAWADRMLDEVYMADKKSLTAGVADGYAGIGIGLAWLLQHDFVNGEADRILGQIDTLMFDCAEESLRSDMLYDSPVLSASVYLQWRLPLCHREQRTTWTAIVSEAEQKFVRSRESAHRGIHDKAGCDHFNRGTTDLCNRLWWDFVKQDTKPFIGIEKAEEIVNQLQKDFVYDMPTVNARISIVGLSLLNDM